jgi:hypothetical protein
MLNVDRIVRVDASFSTQAAARRALNVLAIMGTTEDVIKANERLRFYADLASVSADFGTTAPETLAATVYFSQKPRPSRLAIAKWFSNGTPAELYGGALGDSDLTSIKEVTAGAFKIEVDGVEKSYSTLDFSSAANLNAVASILDTAMSADGISCIYDGVKLVLSSDAKGASKTLSYAIAPDAGTDITTILKINETNATLLLDGTAAETALQAVDAICKASSEWYGLSFACTLSDADIEAIAGRIEAETKPRIVGFSTSSPACLDSTITTDIGSELKALSYDRSIIMYDNDDSYAMCAFFGRAFTTDFSQSNSTLTMKFKIGVGITAEDLTEAQATTLANKNINVYAKYDNDTAIIQEGSMASGAFFDEIHGVDWLQNALQMAGYNVLYASKTKVPQTDKGVSRFTAAYTKVLEEAVRNGLVAPGVWNADGFGQLEEGAYLPSGYYVYHEPIDQQLQADREARKCPPCRIAAKLAGAIHFANIVLDINR